MSVYGYVRVSTLRQKADGDSLDAQRRQIDGYAHMRGWALDHVFVEEGVSGSIPVVKRPTGGALLDMLAPGDHLVAAKLDRLFRSALDALQTVDDLRKRGVGLHLIDMGGDVSASAVSKMFLTIAAAFAEAERDRIRERVAATCQDLRRQGKRVGGGVPFGWRPLPSPDGKGEILVEHPAEQHEIRHVMAPMRGRGASIRAIVAAERKRGFQVGFVAVENSLRRHAEGFGRVN
jgi:putative DNA-invertase from lambdoid prophage Rac